jgi:hypothetical protein
LGQVVAPEKRHEIVTAAIARIREGASFREISEECGIPLKTLHRWVLNEVPAEYKQLQAECFIARITDADEELRTADNPISISRSREIAKFARWDAERRLPNLFGLKTEVTANIHTSSDDPADALRRIHFLMARQAAQDAETVDSPKE